jgi:hypothetical protein
MVLKLPKHTTVTVRKITDQYGFVSFYLGFRLKNSNKEKTVEGKPSGRIYKTLTEINV